MTNLASAFQPAIDALEKDLADLERQANALLTSINLLREKVGLPPHPGGWSNVSAQHGDSHSGTLKVKLHSDSFTGKKLGSAVREYLQMRKSGGGDAPATSREIFDALKEGGFISGAKDDATGLVVLRTMLRKNTVMFAKLQNGKYGLRAWYPNLKAPKDAPSGKVADEEESPFADEDDESPFAEDEDTDSQTADKQTAATPKGATAA
jgi:hypothetical protein